MAGSYAERLAELEAEYSRLFDEIEARHGGVDYQGRLADLRRQIDSVKKNVERFSALRRAVEAEDPKTAANGLVEALLGMDDAEEVAADFIEDEVGRFDWVNNWSVIKGREDVLEKVRAYLILYNIRANPQEIVNIIDRMTQENPGRWK